MWKSGSAGDLNLNGEFPLTSNGVYIGAQTYPNFASDMAQLKQGTVKRVTFSIGSSNFGDWEDIKALVDSQGTGPTSILYKDFQALKAAIPALDAIDFDDENSFDASSTVAFGVMLGGLGLKSIPDAFDNKQLLGERRISNQHEAAPALWTASTCRHTRAAREIIHASIGTSERYQYGPVCGTRTIPRARCNPS